MSEVSKEAGNAIDLLQDLVGRARRAGADAADAVFFEGISLSHARRLGKTEKLERSEGQDLGLRVLVGKQQAMVLQVSKDDIRPLLVSLEARTGLRIDAAAIPPQQRLHGKAVSKIVQPRSTTG